MKKYWILLTICIGGILTQSCQTQRTHASISERPMPAFFAGTTDSLNSGQFSWKNYFEDPYLHALIDTALQNNVDLQVTFQRIEANRADILRAEGFLRPQVNAQNSNALRKYGLYTMDGAGNISTEMLPGKIVPIHLPDFLIGATASWELDIWGKLKNNKKAAIARYLSSVEGAQWVKANLVTDVALLYYELLALDNEMEILRETIQKQEEALKIVQIQKDAGEGTELAAQQFKASLLNFRAMLFQTQQNRNEKENQINFLVGRYPQPILREKEGLYQAKYAPIEVGLPAQLLRNRPDIRAAERLVEASKYDIEIAKAAFLPSINLTGSLGFQAFNPRFLFQTPASIAYGLIGNIAAPLINKKAIEANFNTVKAQQTEALYMYQKRILEAFVEVTNEQNKWKNYEQMYQLKVAETQELENAVQSANLLYLNGRANYLEVLFAQQNTLKTKLESLEVKKKQRMTAVQIYKALGGGWR